LYSSIVTKNLHPSSCSHFFSPFFIHAPRAGCSVCTSSVLSFSYGSLQKRHGLSPPFKPSHPLVGASPGVCFFPLRTYHHSTARLSSFIPACVRSLYFFPWGCPACHFFADFLRPSPFYRLSFHAPKPQRLLVPKVIHLFPPLCNKFYCSFWVRRRPLNGKIPLSLFGGILFSGTPLSPLFVCCFRDSDFLSPSPPLAPRPYQLPPFSPESTPFPPSCAHVLYDYLVSVTYVLTLYVSWN